MTGGTYWAKNRKIPRRGTLLDFAKVLSMVDWDAAMERLAWKKAGYFFELIEKEGHSSHE